MAFKRPVKQTAWKLGDPIPANAPTCQIRCGLSAKVWFDEGAGGVSTGPSIETEFTVPVSALKNAEDEISLLLGEIVGKRLGEALENIREFHERSR